MDEYEWTNLANNPEFEAVKKKLAAWLPKEEVEQIANKKKNKRKSQSEAESKGKS